MTKAVVILSGGLDSSTVAAIAAAAGHELYGLTFSYGQTLAKEIECAKQTAEIYHFKEHKVLSIPIYQIGAGSLVDGKPIPKGRDISEMQEEIPATYVTFRNGIFLSLAAAFAEARAASFIYGGWNVVDYSGYPDCRKEFLESMERTIKLGTKTGAEGGEIKIQAPLLFLNKAAIIRWGLDLGVSYSKTWSCYEGKEKPCGQCDSCQLRLNGFKEIGVTDPLMYL